MISLQLGDYSVQDDDLTEASFCVVIHDIGSPNSSDRRGLAEDDLETNLQRDENARLCNMVNQLVDELTPSAPNFQLRDADDQLVS